MSGTTNLGTNFENAGESRSQTGEIHRRDVAVINNSLIRRIHRKVISLEFDLVAIPGKLGKVLALYPSEKLPSKG